MAGGLLLDGSWPGSSLEARLLGSLRCLGGDRDEAESWRLTDDATDPVTSVVMVVGQLGRSGMLNQ